MSESAAPAANDLAVKLILSGAVALIVGGAAAYSEIGVGLIVLAVVAAVAGFWILDALMSPSPGSGPAPGAAGSSRPAGVLPETGTESLPPTRGVEPPRVAEPATPDPAASVERQTATLDPTLFDPRSVEIKTNSQGKSRVFSIRVAKHGNAIAECEDAVAVDPRRGVLAVADGASSSFGAGIWADTLAKQFVSSTPKPLSVGSFSDWLAQARGLTPGPGGEAGDPNGWWSEEGARQGAFSTVVGAAIMTDGGSRVATVMCLGDSCAFVLTGPSGERVVRRSLPYEDSEQFGSHPALLGSMPDRRHDEPTWTTIPTSAGDLLVLASDAVSEWLLGDPRRFQLFDRGDPEAIASHLITERADGRMANDDLTIAVLELAN